MTVKQIQQLDRIESILLELWKKYNKSGNISSSFYTEEEVCQVLGIKRSTLQTWKTKGIIPHYRLSNSRICCYDKQEIDNFIRNHKTKSKEIQ